MGDELASTACARQGGWGWGHGELSLSLGGKLS
jgi:hypothetical protein